MITIYYPPYAFGGDAIYVYRLAKELVRQGHEVDVVHCADSFHVFRARADPSAFPSNDEVAVHKLESGFGTLAPLLSHQTGRPWLTAEPIKRILNSKRFDVIHYHNVSLFGPGILEIEPPHPAVKLYTAHDHWLVCPTSVLWKNRTHVCTEPACWSCTVRSGRPPQLWRSTGLLERATEHVDQFLSPSRFSANKHAERGFTRPFEVLNYFVDPPETSDGERPHERPYYLFVGRLESYKGVRDLLPAFEGDGPYDLLIAGDGAERASLKRAAAGNPRVRFMGWVNPDRLGNLYRHALASLAPSRTYETFGIVVIESYARRTPVIVRDLGPLPEVVEDGKGGLVFSTEDELRERLERVYRDPELRERLAANAYAAYQERWTPRAHLDRYLEIVREKQSEQIAEAAQFNARAADGVQSLG